MSQGTDLDATLERAAQGDEAAIARLLYAHNARLIAYVTKHMPSDLAAMFEPRDVVQDTYFQAVRQIATFRPDGPDPVLRWLLTIARNSLTDLVRMHRSLKRGGGKARARAGDNSVSSALAQLAAHRRTPSQSAAAHEFMATLERSIGQLPGDYQRVVTLRHIEGLDVAETARRMNRGPGAIHMLCSRALQALRENMKSASLYR